MHCPQIGLAPIADGVKSPGFKAPHRLVAPALVPVRAEFALKVGCVKVEGATMIERAAGLGPQTAAVVVLVPVSRELALLWRQVAEHELAALDIGCSGQPNHVHPDREEAMTLGGNEPPSPVQPLSAKEAGCAKTAGLQNPAEAIAPRGIGKPLRDRARFLGT